MYSGDGIIITKKNKKSIINLKNIKNDNLCILLVCILCKFIRGKSVVSGRIRKNHVDKSNKKWQTLSKPAASWRTMRLSVMVTESPEAILTRRCHGNPCWLFREIVLNLFGIKSNDEDMRGCFTSQRGARPVKGPCCWASVYHFRAARWKCRDGSARYRANEWRFILCRNQGGTVEYAFVSHPWF